MNRFVILFALVLFLTSMSLAQKDGCADASDLRAWKTTILMNYQSTKMDEKHIAVDAGQKYVEKTGRCGIKDEFANWINSHLAGWQQGSSAAATVQQTNSAYDAELAKKLGADDRGMKWYVLCILKTGSKDEQFKGKERDDIFVGHFANIQNLAGQGKLAIAGPFGKNDRAFGGLYIFNVPTIEEAEKLVVLDPAVKAGIFVPELMLWYGSAALMTTYDVHKRIVKPQPKSN